MLFSSLLVAAVAASAAPIAKLQQREPTGWASKLEPYDTYHVRYVALGCSKQHNTQFFTDCCHPLKNGTDLSSRPSYCTPNATALASASARIAKQSGATTAPLPSASDDADDEYCSDAAPSNSGAPAPSAAVGTPLNAPAPSPAPTTSAADAQATPDASSSSTTTTEAAPSSTTTTDAAPSSSPTAEADSASSAIDNNEAFAAAAAPTPSSSSSDKKEAPTQAPSSSTTTTTDQPQPTSAAPTQGGGGGGSGQTYGDAYATFFYQNGVAGACGTVHSDSDAIVAIDTNGWWQNTGQVSDLCGRQVRITRVSDGRQVTATIADACPTCDTNNSLDLSVGAFNQIATPAEGMVGITWQFI
ncbi:Papain inhibitor [Vanrija pseudolonga]|uniref:Papain inhibitor n=1 Tax=Vanrija pseudolonga TaxID=143232 RepID=A0AAF1BST7_9TREE|nr:Papain inhibitor [Vanrija pseudolonga]